MGFRPEGDNISANAPITAGGGVHEALFSGGYPSPPEKITAHGHHGTQEPGEPVLPGEPIIPNPNSPQFEQPPVSYNVSPPGFVVGKAQQA
jgi:hypothetical protein